MAVCPEARALIEGLEPGVHQFLPVEIVRRRGAEPIRRLDGRVLDAPYYGLNVHALVDAVWVERSEVRVTSIAARAPNVWRRMGSTNVVLRREVIEGHHVRRGRHQLADDLFFSDALAHAVEEERLRELRFTRLEKA